MRWRFTVRRDTADDIEPFPDISTWEQDPLGSADAVLPWSGVGTLTPSYNFVGATIIPVTSTQYLYTDYEFVPGWYYKIDVTLTRTDSESPTNPRTLSLRIFDLLNNQKESESHAIDVGSNTYSIEFTAGSNYERFALRFISGSDRLIEIDTIDITITPVDSVTEVVIDEPDGWADSQLTMERDPQFKSLIEFFEGTFIFYGSNGEVDGGYETLVAWEKEGGPDATIYIDIEFDSYDDENWITLFNGQYELAQLIDTTNRTIRIPIIPEDFWAKFMSRKETPVNLKSELDLDDEVVSQPVSEITIELPAQKIRYNGEYNWLDSFTYEFLEYNQHYAMQIDWDEAIRDDIRKFTLPRAIVEDIGNDGVNTGEAIVGIFEAPWDGDYEIDISFPFAFYNDDDDEWNSVSSVNFWMHGVNEQQSVESRFIRSSDSSGSDSWNIFSFNKTIHAVKGQQYKVYGTFAGPVVSGDLPRYTIFGERRQTWMTVRLATTNTVVLFGEQSVDGEMTSTEPVLVKNQGDASFNGIYLTDAGAWTRVSGFDNASELLNSAVYVTDGDDNSGTAWRQSESEIELGDTAVTFVLMIPNDERLRPFPESTVDNHFDIIADTTFKRSRTTGFLLHDAFAAVLKQLGLGFPNPLYSEVLGSEKTLARQYETAGCNWAYGLTRGLQLRGFSLADKQFAMSFMECWQGADPILGLGLGYEDIPAQTIIPESAVVADLIDWEDAGGVHFGTWSYTSPDIPHVSVNGSGGVSGYAKGACATQAGETYPFSFQLEIFDTGLSGEITEVTVAILDASDNEITTEVFDYTDAGVKTESFFLTPPTDGVSVALRVTNNTPFDTKNYEIQAFVGEEESEPIDMPAEKRIRIEKTAYFYQPETSVLLSNIEQIERSYDAERMYKKIVIGYREWKTDDISGIDDPQTKHTYATRLKKTGKEIEILSEFIAASLAIEQARRQAIDRSTDYKYDDSTFIIALNALYESDSSPDTFLPELDENFVQINNLLNSDTRYNTRLTPGRNLLRQKDFLDIGLQSYLGSRYKFTRGEGNYDVESQMIASSPDSCGDDYDGDLLIESQNFQVEKALYSENYYAITDYPMSIEDYVTIRNNRRKGIGISQTSTGHKLFFIDKLVYRPVVALANITGWTIDRLDLIVPENLAPTADCYPETAPLCGDDALTDEFGAPITDEFGECITGDGEVESCLGDGLVDELEELITDELGECIYV